MSNEERPEVLQRVKLVVIRLQRVLVHSAHNIQSALLQHVAEVDERVCVRSRSVQQDRRSPILGVILIKIQLEQHLPHLVVNEGLRNIAPFLPWRGVQEKNKDDDQNDHRDNRLATIHSHSESSQPIDVKHDDKVQQSSCERNLPCTRLEARTVVRCASDTQHESR